MPRRNHNASGNTRGIRREERCPTHRRCSHRRAPKIPKFSEFLVKAAKASDREVAECIKQDVRYSIRYKGRTDLSSSQQRQRDYHRRRYPAYKAVLWERNPYHPVFGWLKQQQLT